MKAVLYSRASTDTPFALDVLRGHQLRLMDYAAANGIEIVASYADVGYSGSTLERPGLQAVIQAVRDGTAETILVVDRDRLNKGKPLEALKDLPVIEVGNKTPQKGREVSDHVL